MPTGSGSRCVRPFILAGLLLAGGAASACIEDIGIDANSPGPYYLFPNWTQSLLTVFDLQFCDDTTCTWSAAAYDADLVGLTLVNYGTATNTDLAKLYWCPNCTGACGVMQTMTWAGVWTIGGSPHPVWTWSVATPLVINTDPCNSKGGCTPACYVTMNLYADVTGCPTNGATVAMGPNYDPAGTPTAPGGASDQSGCVAPWYDASDPSPKTVAYALKQVSAASAAPGDTLTYTIYCGKAGSNPISNVVIYDSLPAYTTYVPGSASTAPDAGWDPFPGPPLALRWTLPGFASTAGGATTQLTFQVTVDWGNQPFDPGSGPVAAPENALLSNPAQVDYVGSSCSPTSAITLAAQTAVKRFLFYMYGDNDLLFAPSFGQPPDEVIYTVFIKNTSTTKTWWGVHVWDTVPASLNAWCVNCGMYDPCFGWTMTPSGCAPYSPGSVVTASKTTLLTWRLDMPPGYSLSVQWKAQVAPTAAAGINAVNLVSLLEYGFNGVNGTANSQTVTFFTHVAPIVLATTYISYTSYFGADTGNTTCPGFFLPFWPLNKKTDFALYGYEVSGGATWAFTGGVSPPISNLIGTCTGGFTSYDPGGVAGCGAPRAPAMFNPAQWYNNGNGGCPSLPFHFIYKVVSNSPFLWQTRSHVLADNQDHHFWNPTTTISFRGFIGYTYRQEPAAANTGCGDSVVAINMSTDPTNAWNGLPTDVYAFEWDPINQVWQFDQVTSLDVESLSVLYMGTLAAQAGHYRFLSSQANIMLYSGHNTFDTLSPSGCCDNHGTMAPTRETGNVVSDVGSGTFYLICEPWGAPKAAATYTQVVIGNDGLATATYTIYKYGPNGTSPAPVPINLAGTSGRWTSVATDTVGAGQTNVNNPHAYCGEFDRNGFTGSGVSAFKVQLTAGGPIQIEHGQFLPNVYSGGAVLHSPNSLPSNTSGQTGIEFWYHQTADQSYSCGGGPNPSVSALAPFVVFCPKIGMAVQCTGEPVPGGASATYTTNGQDEAIAFLDNTILATNGTKRVWHLTVLNNGNQLNAVGIYQQCMATEKGFTSPFVSAGTHYAIVAPPVVFVGQPFWITLIVLAQGDATKTDYCGTTSFTSTDPNAKMFGGGMDAYNFTWNSSTSCSGAVNENGVYLFVNVTFNQLGVQTLVAADTVDGSITGLASLLVVGVDVKLQKLPPFQTAASGDTVQFQICWSNYSSATAFSFTITDAVPQGTSYVPEVPSAMFCGSSVPVTADVAYSTVQQATPPAAFTTVTSGALPGASTWLRWTVRSAFPNSTGCACFRVAVQ